LATFFCRRQYESNFNDGDVIGPKDAKLGEITQNKGITPFKIIQGYQFRYQWKARMGVPIIYVNNSNLRPILHHFRDMADYWSDFRCRGGFNALVLGEPLNSGMRNLASRN